MSVIGSNILAGASGQGGAYNLTNSLRFRSSASAYLNRTPASAGNRKTWTVNLWVKRGVLGATQFLIDATAGTGTRLYFSSSDNLQFDSGGSGIFTTSQVFRDPSAWYMVTLAIDTTQATASNRVKLYINGSQVTAFSATSYPSQNTDTDWNNTVAHYIGRNGNASVSYLDGYLAEFNSIDGQALTPSSFGETSSTTGVWIPKKYTGTYGTNGFYLPFTDNSALTTSSNVGLGKDFSGNSNYWTTNNISITSGSTYDSMTDVPTLTSATAANYAVINPLDYNSTYLTLSAGNLQQTYGGVSAAAASRATMTLPTTGKYYWEVTLTTIGTNNTTIRAGICSPTTAISGNSIDGSATSYLQITNGQKRNNATDSTYGAGFSNGQILQVLYDATAGSIYFGQNDSYANGSGSFNQTFSNATAAFTGLSGEFMPCFITYGGSDIAVNFGQRPFAYTPPTGFVALNTFNLPTPTIGATASTTANKYFDATTFDGVTGGGTVTNSGSMQPDFVWMKVRNNANNHELADSVRGTPYASFSNLTNAEVSDTRVSAFNSNGFSYGTNSNSAITGRTVVGWQWRASNATAVTNTAGTITSTVSANTSAGFSIVTYTGNATAGATVGHGLGVTPVMFMIKGRSIATGWNVYHQNANASPASGVMTLQTTDAFFANSAWNSTTPTSSVFSLGGTGFGVNNSGETYVAYCFAQIAGYSAFGSYTGNGSSDGTFVYTGFRPRFVIIKSSTFAGADWVMYDSTRNTYNALTSELVPNSSASENNYSGVARMDFVSNGIKIRTSGAGLNNNGSTYIYMAFAESPFRYANAR